MPPMGKALLRVMKLGFSCTLRSTIPSGADIGIFLLAVDECSCWLSNEAVECHVIFCQLKILPQCGIASKFFDCLCR